MIKIISTGSSTAKVIDENGNEIKKVQSVNIKMSPGEYHTATLEVFNIYLETEAIEDYTDFNLEEFTSEYLEKLKDAITKELELRQ